MARVGSEEVRALRPGLEAEPPIVVEVRLGDSLKGPHEVYLGGVSDGELLGGQVEPLRILLLGEVDVLERLPPIMRLADGQGPVVHVAVRFLALGLDAGRVDRVVVELHLPDDPLKLGAVDGGPAVLLQGLAELGVIVGVDVGLLRDPQQIGISGLS